SGGGAGVSTYVFVWKTGEATGLSDADEIRIRDWSLPPGFVIADNSTTPSSAEDVRNVFPSDDSRFLVVPKLDVEEVEALRITPPLGERNSSSIGLAPVTILS